MSLRKQMKLGTPETMETEDESNGNQVNHSIVADGTTVPTESNNQPENPPPTPPPYLKLIADCWEHIFDYLSMKDVLVMGQTCKRMEQMAGYYVREYFPEMRYDLVGGKVQLKSVNYIDGHSSIDLRPDFYRYISKLCISNKSRLDFYLNGKMFPALKTLILEKTTSFEYIRDLLKNVENIYMERCDIKSKTIKQFAIRCPKLKSLHILSCDITDKAFQSLFSQHFPMLERLQYKAERSVWYAAKRIDELETFLEVHSNLKHFGCSVRDLWANRDVLRKTNIQLNTLAVDFHGWDHRQKCESFTRFLNKLHKRGVYKTLHLSFDKDSSISKEHFNKLSAIEVLSEEDEPSSYMTSDLTGLKELHGYSGFEDQDDTESVSTSLIKLERLVYQHACIEDYLPYIQNSKRLKSIKIQDVIDEGQDVNAFELNEERKKCTNGSPIILHLPEPTYLRAKWKTENLNLSHVNIARFVVQDYY